MAKSSKYTVSSNLVLLHKIFHSIPVAPYCNLTDVELCAWVKIPCHRDSVRCELLRRHAPLIAEQVLHYFRCGVGGSELGDYESLAVSIALNSYDSYDVTRSAAPSSYVFGLVSRRLLDAQRRTSIESFCRWPIRKLQFHAWLRGDYDKFPEFREYYESLHGLTYADRSSMYLLYAHLINSTGVNVSLISLDNVLKAGKYGSANNGQAILKDSRAETATSIINRVLLEDAFASLSSDQDRQILNLFAFEDKSMVEISKELQIPLAEVRKRIKSSQNYLKQMLADV